MTPIASTTNSLLESFMYRLKPFRFKYVASHGGPLTDSAAQNEKPSISLGQQNLIQTNLYFHTRCQVELHERIDGFFSGFNYI